MIEIRLLSPSAGEAFPAPASGRRGRDRTVGPAIPNTSGAGTRVPPIDHFAGPGSAVTASARPARHRRAGGAPTPCLRAGQPLVTHDSGRSQPGARVGVARGRRGHPQGASRSGNQVSCASDVRPAGCRLCHRPDTRDERYRSLNGGISPPGTLSRGSRSRRRPSGRRSPSDQGARRAD